MQDVSRMSRNHQLGTRFSYTWWWIARANWWWWFLGLYVYVETIAWRRSGWRWNGILFETPCLSEQSFVPNRPMCAHRRPFHCWQFDKDLWVDVFLLPWEIHYFENCLWDFCWATIKTVWVMRLPRRWWRRSLKRWWAGAPRACCRTRNCAAQRGNLAGSLASSRDFVGQYQRLQSYEMQKKTNALDYQQFVVSNEPLEATAIEALHGLEPFLAQDLRCLLPRAASPRLEEDRAQRRADSRPKYGLVAVKRFGATLRWLLAAVEISNPERIKDYHAGSQRSSRLKRRYMQCWCWNYCSVIKLNKTYSSAVILLRYPCVCCGNVKPNIFCWRISQWYLATAFLVQKVVQRSVLQSACSMMRSKQFPCSWWLFNQLKFLSILFPGQS